jgi:RimJ/RimL family protein N-acetyltransferase
MAKWGKYSGAHAPGWDALGLCTFYNRLGKTTIRYFSMLGDKAEQSHCSYVCSPKADDVDLFMVSAGWREEIVGWVFLRDISATYPELGIVLADSYQGRGLGGRLMGVLLDTARQLGVETVMLNVVEDNARAIPLYLKFGFRVVWGWCKVADGLNYLRMELNFTNK